jgi:protein SDA1
VQGAELLDENISSEGEDLDDDDSDAFVGSDDETDLPSAPRGTEENMESLSDANNEDVKEEDEASEEDGTGQN